MCRPVLCRPMLCRPMIRRLAIAALCALAGIASTASAQQADPLAIELADPVVRLLEAPYLEPEEARQLRIRHGVWQPDDLVTPTDRARVALTRGALDDPALGDPETDFMLRAQAALEKGDPRATISIIDDVQFLVPHLPSMVLRAQALDALGKYKEANAALDGVVERLQAERLDDAGELLWAVEGLILRQRLGGTRDAADRTGEAVAADFRVILQLLAQARDELDRLDPRPRLLEAELLSSKGQYQQSAEAALESLRLNPSQARAWSVLGRIAVRGLDRDRVELVGQRLELLASSVDEQGLGIGPEPAIIRAKMRLRQGDPDGARATLDEIADLFPQHREVLAMRAATEAVGFDVGLADQLLAQLDELSPGSALGYATVGAALAEARQYGPAADYLAEAAERLPTWAEPIVELGLLEIQSGRDLQARAALARAVRLDPFNVRAENSLTLITGLMDEFERIEGEHFEVRYKPGPDSVLAREMLPVLEAIHQRVAGEQGFKHEPAQKTLIELMPTHEWFSVRITGMPEIHTMAAATGPVIAMEAPREGPGMRAGPYDWERTLAHEYAHTVTLSRTSNRIPHWFTEAAAVYIEDGEIPVPWPPMLTDALQQGELFDLESINLAFARPRRPIDRTLAYAQGWWMYSFMAERWGPDAPLALMDRYARGESESTAMPEVLGLAPAGFLDEFFRWAEQQTVEWGLALPDGTPTLAELWREAGSERPFRPMAQAVPALATLLEQHPDHPQLARAHAQSVRLAAGGALDGDVLAAWERYAELVPADAEPRRVLARHYLASDSPQLAIPHLAWLDRREMTTPAYASELARQHAAIGELARAAHYAERATRIAPFDAATRELAATVAIQTEDYDTAERHLRALIAFEPDRDLHQRRLAALSRLRER